MTDPTPLNSVKSIKWSTGKIQGNTVQGFDTPRGAIVLSKSRLEVTEPAVTFKTFCKSGGFMKQLDLTENLTVGELKDFLDLCGLREFTNQILYRWAAMRCETRRTLIKHYILWRTHRNNPAITLYVRGRIHQIRSLLKELRMRGYFE